MGANQSEPAYPSSANMHHRDVDPEFWKLYDEDRRREREKEKKQAEKEKKQALKQVQREKKTRNLQRIPRLHLDTKN